jgi:hypothetical protein
MAPGCKIKPRLASLVAVVSSSSISLRILSFSAILNAKFQRYPKAALSVLPKTDCWSQSSDNFSTA